LFHSNITELYIDTDKKSYNELGFQRFGFLGLFPAVLSAAARAAAARVSRLDRFSQIIFLNQSNRRSMVQ
jgi:hypothetical protein